MIHLVHYIQECEMTCEGLFSRFRHSIEGQYEYIMQYSLIKIFLEKIIQKSRKTA